MLKSIWYIISRYLAASSLLVPFCGAVAMAASGTSKTFQLVPEKGFLSCFAASGRIPTATVTVQKGSSNDTLVLSLKNFKPGLAFDLFTVEDSNLLPDGDPDPDFINFGFAWYQSVIQVNKVGGAKVKIQTILVN